MTPKQAESRLAKLLKDGGIQFHMPMLMVELLRLHRIEKLPLDNEASFQGRGVSELKVVAERLFGRQIDMNWGYVRDAFDPRRVNPDALKLLAEQNRNGEIETFIYQSIIDRWVLFNQLVGKWSESRPETFSIREFVSDTMSLKVLRNAIGKIFETITYALLQGIVTYSKAKVVLSLDPMAATLLNELSEFTDIFFGLPPNEFELPMSGKVYRAGLTFASDSGIDMWSNYGPVIQVKYSNNGLSPSRFEKTIKQVKCDRIIIICKRRQIKKHAAYISLLDANRYARLVDEKRIIEWYEVVFHQKFLDTVGSNVHSLLIEALRADFPVPKPERVQELMAERKYRIT